MADCYSFPYSFESEARLAIFFPDECIGKDLWDAFQKNWKNNPIIEQLTIISFDENHSLESVFAKEEVNKIALLSLCRKERIAFFHVDVDGNFFHKSKEISQDLKNALMKAAFDDIFKRREGCINAPRGAHFKKPSGKHANGFIRAANLLVSFPEVAFLSISLFEHLDENVNRILIDTSSIAHLIDTAIIIRNRLKKNTGYTPSVNSFSSYSYTHKEDVDLGVTGKRLIIISASTSGNLSEYLRKENEDIAEAEVLTFVRTGTSEKPLSRVLFQTPANITSYPENECPWCSEGLKLLNFAGEQFLQESPQPLTKMLSKIDQTIENSNFFKKYAGKEVLKLELKQDDVQKQLFVDVKNILEREDDFSAFHDAFNKTVRGSVSVDAPLIVYLEDAASHKMASMATAFAKEKGLDVKCLSENDLEDLRPQEAKKLTGNILVLASAITSGRKLLDVSRPLRHCSNAAGTVYLVGFSKLPDNNTFKQLESNLQYGGNRLEIIETIEAPRSLGSFKTYAEKAIDLLSGQDLSSGRGSRIFSKFPEFPKRYNTDHFLPFREKNSWNPLEIRPNFAFFDGKGLNLSQADVVWIMQTILHNWRQKNSSDSYQLLLLDPAVFSRFNDGIVQASILRSALPSELNYEVDEEISQRASDVILPIIKSHASNEGEAAGEFLLALATGHIKLAKKNVDEVIAMQNSMPDHFKKLLKAYKLWLNANSKGN